MKLTKLLLILIVLFTSRGLRAETEWNHFWNGSKYLVSQDDLIILGTGTAAAVGALYLDKSVEDYFKGHNRLGGWETVGNDYLGTGIAGGITGLGTLCAGAWGDHSYDQRAGQTHLETLAATGIYTEVLKVLFRRDRPDHGSLTSFPSGHTSIMFASAASLMDFYGPWVGVPTLLLAGYTGVCRLAVNVHYLSDVVFGAALGYAVGHAYAQYNLSQICSDKNTSYFYSSTILAVPF
jgi:hypothetical protein